MERFIQHLRETLLFCIAIALGCGCSSDKGGGQNQSITGVSAPVQPASCFIYAAGDVPGESHFLSANLRTTSGEVLGPADRLKGVDGLAVHPQTRILFAVAGRDNGRPDGGNPASLHQIDAKTGAPQEVGSVGFSNLRGLNFRSSDATLWTWVRERGLVQIDASTGRGTLRFANTTDVRALAWSNDGASLYLTDGTNLWVYQPATGTLTQQPGTLPAGTIALHVRPDGLLLGLLEEPQPQAPASTGASNPHDPTVLRLFAYDVAQGQVAATYDIPTDQISKADISPPKDFRRFSALTWQNGCGNPSTGGPTKIIIDIVLDRTQVCSGESVLVQVNATHPENPSGRVDVVIDGLPGSTRYVQFPSVPANAFVPGKRRITIAARTAEGHIDLQHAEVDVIDCGVANTSPLVRVLPNPFHDATADFTVTSNVPALSFLGATTYFWEFGDGTSVETTVPHVAHSYASSLARDEIYSVFQARLTVRRLLLPDLVTPKTVTVTNMYALARLRGRIKPPVRQTSDLVESSGTLSGQFTVENLEDAAITFDRRRLEYRYCDPDRNPTLLPAETTSVVVNARSQSVQSVALTAVPADVCGVAVHLLGRSPQALPMRSSAYLDIPARAPRQIIQDAQLVATLNRLKDQGLLPNPNRVTDEDLHRLVHERKLLPQDIAESSNVAPFQSEETAMQLGEECEPGQTPPDPNLECLPSGEWSEPQAMIPNAQKGDVLLVASCSFIGTLLRQLTPVQRYSHEGIMTRNFVEVSHSTSSEDRATDERHGLGIEGSDGIEIDVIKFGWPGVIHQTVTQAFRGQARTSPDGVEYGIDAFSPNPVKCPSDRMITHPLVMRPPLDAPPSVRADLHRAADVAQSLEGHYRFYAYTEGNVAFSPGFDSPDGKPATVSSQYIWWALKTAGLNLEGPTIEQKDANGLAGLHFGGAQVDGETDDGLYLYTQAEREDAAEWMYDHVHGQVLGISGTFGQFALDAPSNYANQLVNCFAWDFCGDNDIGLLCALDEGERPDTWPAGCCIAPEPEPGEPPEPPEVCRAKDDEIWRDPDEGRAVSPDNFMFWDQPALTEGAEIGEDGVYGDFERMIYRDSGRVPVFRWAPKQGFAAVQGTVLVQGETACVDDTACQAGDVCHERACRHACTADADCPTGATCHVNGFCARPVPDATVFFAEAAPDTIRTTDASGRFAAYQNIKVSGNPSEINARLVTDPDPNVVGDESVLLGSAEFTLQDQQIADVPIVLLPADPTLRQVTASGLAHMLDCDCDSANERGTRNFTLTCRVDPNNPVDNSIHISQDNMCVDEIGIKIDGECLLLAGQNDRTVRMQGTVTLFEGEVNSCGGTEVEDSFSFAVDLPPAELHPPGTRFTINMENGLKHEDLCVYLVAVVDCDDEAWGMGAASAVNEIQSF